MVTRRGKDMIDSGHAFRNTALSCSYEGVDSARPRIASAILVPVLHFYLAGQRHLGVATLASAWEKRTIYLLAKKDRKKSLDDIPQIAFPEPTAMPVIPESKDGEKMAPPPLEAPKTDENVDAKS